MKSEFRKRPTGTALALFGEGLEDARDYRIENLKNNRIEGILPLTTGSEDGVYKLFYDITGRQALSTLFSKKKLERKHVRALIRSIAVALESVSEYLLEPAGLVFDPDLIYMSGDGEAGFLYYPDRTETVECALHSLGEYLIGRVDHGDPDAVKLSYGFFEATGKDYLVVDDLKNLCVPETGEVRRNREEFCQSRNMPRAERMEALPQEILKENVPKESIPEEKGPSEMGPRKKTLHTEEPRKKESRKKEPCKKEPRRNSRKERQAKPGGKTVVDYLIWAAAAGIIIWLIYDNFLRRLGNPKGMVAAVLLVLLAMDIIITCIVRGKRKAKESGLLTNADKKAMPAQKRPKEKQDIITNPGSKGEENKREYYGTGLLRDSAETGILREECEKTRLLSESDSNMPGLIPGPGNSGKALYITSFPFVVGKSLSYADGAIDDTYISRVHCRFEKEGSEFFCVDLNSRNGTSLNGMPLDPNREYVIHEGDELKLGRSRYTFSMVGVSG